MVDGGGGGGSGSSSSSSLKSRGGRAPCPYSFVSGLEFEFGFYSRAPFLVLWIGSTVPFAIFLSR